MGNREVETDEETVSLVSNLRPQKDATKTRFLGIRLLVTKIKLT
jgi:hypothetical protein